ncbi:MAG: carboxypeptidase-like regulatory domain-containing protein [Pseudarcicella sp.]|nr:carboxypeptidase-like regulatory domain-containing protein [Pseudarcicella sp.]MBP6410576.1 carboxypeptidase-like regulatory domain-containing protein [Pseudarcicella sp.]
MVHRILSTALLLFVTMVTFSQNITQTIRGIVIDKESKSPLAFASVILLQSNSNTGTSTDALGNFALQNVQIGRQSIQISHQGYKTAVVSDIQLSSAKENVLQIELEENLNVLAEVTV